MKTPANYLDAAKEKAGIATDMQLNFALGYRGLTISKIRHRAILPSDEIMVKLADMAGVSKEQALMDLNIWRAAGTPAEQIYKRMAAMMRNMVICIITMLTILTVTYSAPASARETAIYSSDKIIVYIMEIIGLLLKRIACAAKRFINHNLILSTHGNAVCTH